MLFTSDAIISKCDIDMYQYQNYLENPIGINTYRMECIVMGFLAFYILDFQEKKFPTWAKCELFRYRYNYINIESFLKFHIDNIDIPFLT